MSEGRHAHVEGKVSCGSSTTTKRSTFTLCKGPESLLAQSTRVQFFLFLWHSKYEHSSAVPRVCVFGKTLAKNVCGRKPKMLIFFTSFEVVLDTSSSYKV